MFDMVSLTAEMLDEGRKFKSLVVLIDREHMALSIHFDALSERLAHRLWPSR